ncbi:tyrosine-type recombinase/integrase [Haloarcula rubripromontorii]|uniref:Tyrosine-type recombinase/integrase n=1 Tax=Haloarcula rubripromontorii TaxID=1705562 RepID=A0A847U575_9EURY|nr:site-specific integrase [Haloarcula rubripromontorii]NLV08149.1 tyrosine-type recombinase/integrase [Haloarcula rubripromontorii]
MNRLPPAYDATPGGDALETAIEKRLVDIDSGRYRTNVASVLRKFAAWSRDQHGISSPEDIDDDLCRQYARDLARADDRDDISPETARRYFAYVRSFLTWAVYEGLIPTNPAKTNHAEGPLPTGETETDQQYWTARDRDAICATATARVDKAGESDDVDRTAAYRDQALVFLLAYSGARSAELVAVSDDEERNGLRWRHVDLDAGTMQVFGKNRTRESAPILDDALRPLRRWKQLREPDENEAVFPRLDNATKALDPTPSITTQSARNILADLCEWSDYEFEEPLKPHGARRGLGREIYRENPQLAQDVLRHKSIETTHEGYAQEAAKRTRDEANDIINDESG